MYLVAIAISKCGRLDTMENNDYRTVIRLNSYNHLNELEFTDESCLIIEQAMQMHEKFDFLPPYSNAVDLNINTLKTKILTKN